MKIYKKDFEETKQSYDDIQGQKKKRTMIQKKINTHKKLKKQTKTLDMKKLCEKPESGDKHMTDTDKTYKTDVKRKRIRRTRTRTRIYKVKQMDNVKEEKEQLTKVGG